MSEEEKTQMLEHFKNSENEFPITTCDKTFNIKKNMIVKTEQVTQTIQEEKFTPSVIEPSFGIGRVLSAIFEHCFRMRDEKRTYLSLPPRIAPVKCSILTVISSPEYQVIIQYLSK